MGSPLVGRVVLNLLRFLGYLYYGFYCLSPSFFPHHFGGVLGFLMRVGGLRTSVVKKNLTFIFPKMNGSEQNKIYRSFYQNFGQLFFELMMLFGPLGAFIKRFVDVRGFENLQAAQQKGQGVFILTSHVGNWEVMAGTGGVVLGVDLLMVTKKLKPAWFHEAVELARRRLFVKGTYEPRTLRDVLSHLKKNGVVGFVLDQYTGPPVSVRVPFFGVPVGTGVALATLVKRTGAAVIPVVNYRTQQGRWVIEIAPSLSWKKDPNPQVELAINTAHYTTVLESHIQAHPEQWLWTHRRFKGDLSSLRESEWAQGRA